MSRNSHYFADTVHQFLFVTEALFSARATMHDVIIRPLSAGQ